MKNKISFLSVLALGCSICTLTIVNSAAAQEVTAAKGSRFDEIVVTARKKEENLDEVPIALTAFTPESFEKLNIGDLYDIGKAVPNLFIGNFGNGNPSHTSIFMRGVGQQDHIITVDSGVGLYLHGVYLGRQVGSNLSSTNIERVEVARGPQGTLYGRNSIGGAINFITKKPTGADQATVDLQLGSRDRAKIGVYAETALTDTMFGSISGHYNRRNGVGNLLIKSIKILKLAKFARHLCVHS